MKTAIMDSKRLKGMIMTINEEEDENGEFKLNNLTESSKMYSINKDEYDE